MSNGYEGTILSLHKDCIYVQLDDKAVIFRHTPDNKHGRYHFTPQDEASFMVLDLLTQNNPDGVAFDDVIKHLLRQFQLTQEEATASLNGFLTKLEGYGLLGKVGKPAQGAVKKIDDQKHGALTAKKQKEKAKLDIVAGGTVITTGYVITWYRP